MKFQMTLTGIFLLICTYTDLRDRSIYKRIVYGMMMVSISGHVVDWITGQDSAVSVMTTAAAGLIPGIVCFLISLLTREAFGYGDSMGVAACGLSLGLGSAFELLITGLFLSAIWAVFLCIVRKSDLKKEFPFLPFLSAAFAVQVFAGLSKGSI